MQAEVSEEKVQKMLNAIAWLADAPLFIDGPLVSSFYDAVVQPEGHRKKIVLSLEKYRNQKVDLRGSVKLKVSVSELIKLIFPFLGAEAEAGGEAGAEWSSGGKQGESVEIHSIVTPQRQLVQLAFHYLSSLPSRLTVVEEAELSGVMAMDDEDYIRGLPRSLIFIDFPPGTKFIPMAAEVEGGRVITIFDRLETRREKPLAPPERGPSESEESFAERKDAAWAEYWGWFDRTFSARVALEKVEELVSKEGRVEWVNYRVPRGSDGGPVHLNVCGRCAFSTGTFAYQLIRRGFKHGLRVVGTLKSEPAVNVLAIFEK